MDYLKMIYRKYSIEKNKEKRIQIKKEMKGIVEDLSTKMFFLSPYGIDVELIEIFKIFGYDITLKEDEIIVKRIYTDRNKLVNKQYIS